MANNHSMTSLLHTPPEVMGQISVTFLIAYPIGYGRAKCSGQGAINIELLAIVNKAIWDCFLQSICIFLISSRKKISKFCSMLVK